MWTQPVSVLLYGKLDVSNCYTKPKDTKPVSKYIPQMSHRGMTNAYTLCCIFLTTPFGDSFLYSHSLHNLIFESSFSHKCAPLPCFHILLCYCSRFFFRKSKPKTETGYYPYLSYQDNARQTSPWTRDLVFCSQHSLFSLPSPPQQWGFKNKPSEEEREFEWTHCYCTRRYKRVFL